ncbi:hypothetical protein [Kitasatospora sp. NPDC057936]|uniref:hypothetical protein n=1 Tax=Kitasatospora sp. NPDC057936 TaxID=3346283 RepID=UPI0036DA0CF1
MADRITSGSWKPTGDPMKASGAGTAPATIRGALRARIADRIRNGRKPKTDTAKDATAEQQQDQAGQAAAPGTDLAVPTDATTGQTPNAEPAPDGAESRKTRKRRTATASKRGRTRRRSRPGRGQASRERRRSWRERARDRAGRAKDSRAGAAQEKAEEARPGQGDEAFDSGYRFWHEYKAFDWSGFYAWFEGQHEHRRSPRPPEDFGPPPGWARDETVTVHRTDRPDPDAPAVPAIGRGQAALPHAPYRSGHTRPGTTAPPPTTPAGGPPVRIPAPRTVRGTQYADSDLTIYDVIEADADMGEEIAQGAEEARQTAEGCDLLIGRLEALHAKVIELKVPGVLERMVVSLIDKTGQVKARAEAIAAAIPAAAEAVTTAGDHAADRHKALADAVRDAGHTAPAERDYHNE